MVAGAPDSTLLDERIAPQSLAEAALHVSHTAGSGAPTEQPKASSRRRLPGAGGPAGGLRSPASRCRPLRHPSPVPSPWSRGFAQRFGVGPVSVSLSPIPISDIAGMVKGPVNTSGGGSDCQAASWEPDTKGRLQRHATNDQSFSSGAGSAVPIVSGRHCEPRVPCAARVPDVPPPGPRNT